MLMIVSDQVTEINKFVDRDIDIDILHRTVYTAQSSCACIFLILHEYMLVDWPRRHPRVVVPHLTSDDVKRYERLSLTIWESNVRLTIYY